MMPVPWNIVFGTIIIRPVQTSFYSALTLLVWREETHSTMLIASDNPKSQLLGDSITAKKYAS